MSQIEITREEFERLWSYVPPDEAIGVRFYGPSEKMIAEYKFIGKAQKEVPDCTCGVDPKHDCFAPPWAHHPECPYRTFDPKAAKRE